MRFPNIEAERARRGMSREDFVRPIGVSTKTYSNWQNNQTDIPCTKLILMARFLGCSIDYLIGIESQVNQPN